MLLKKDSLPAAGSGPDAMVADPVFSKKYPTLWAYMSQTKWEDGTDRLPAGIMVFLQDGIFKARFTENETGKLLWIAAPSIFGVLEALEMALNVPQPDWRNDRRAGGGAFKKGKGK